MTDGLPDNRFGEAYKRFIKIEKKSNLTELDVDSVPVWRLVRGQIFDHWLEEHEIQDRTESGRMALNERIGEAAKRIFGDLLSVHAFYGRIRGMYEGLEKGISKLAGLVVEGIQKPIDQNTQAEALIVGFMRPLPGNIRLTEPVEERLRGKFLLIDKAHAGPLRKERIDPSSLDRKIKKYKASADARRLRHAAEMIANAFALDLPYVSKSLSVKSSQYLRQQAFFEKFLSKRNIKVIYLGWNKYYFALLAAAKTLNIPTVEFQHGIIGPYHIQYAWPHDTAPQAYPDTFLNPGSAWPTIADLHEDTNSVDIGSHHMDAMLDRYRNIKKERRLVAIFSQRIIGVRLLQFAAEVAKQCPDMMFTIKLHPTERYQNLMSYLQGPVPANLMIAPKHENSYQLMARAEYQIGVSSTTLVEGLKFGTKTMVVPLPTWEYMKSWLDEGSMELVANPQQVKELLTNGMKEPHGSDNWYAPSKPDQIPIPGLDD